MYEVWSTTSLSLHKQIRVRYGLNSLDGLKSGSVCHLKDSIFKAWNRQSLKTNVSLLIGWFLLFLGPPTESHSSFHRSFTVRLMGFSPGWCSESPTLCCRWNITYLLFVNKQLAAQSLFELRDKRLSWKLSLMCPNSLLFPVEISLLSSCF